MPRRVLLHCQRLLFFFRRPLRLREQHLISHLSIAKEHPLLRVNALCNIREKTNDKASQVVPPSPQVCACMRTEEETAQHEQQTKRGMRRHPKPPREKMRGNTHIPHRTSDKQQSIVYIKTRIHVYIHRFVLLQEKKRRAHPSACTSASRMLVLTSGLHDTPTPRSRRFLLEGGGYGARTRNTLSSRKYIGARSIQLSRSLPA